jgi:hypothetical protein
MSIKIISIYYFVDIRDILTVDLLNVLEYISLNLVWLGILYSYIDQLHNHTILEDS